MVNEAINNMTENNFWSTLFTLTTVAFVVYVSGDWFRPNEKAIPGNQQHCIGTNVSRRALYSFALRELIFLIVLLVCGAATLCI